MRLVFKLSLGAMFAIAIATATVIWLPDYALGIAMLSLPNIVLGALINGIVFGRGYARVFSIGGLLPMAVGVLFSLKLALNLEIFEPLTAYEIALMDSFIVWPIKLIFVFLFPCGFAAVFVRRMLATRMGAAIAFQVHE